MIKTITNNANDFNETACSGTQRRVDCENHKSEFRLYSDP